MPDRGLARVGLPLDPRKTTSSRREASDGAVIAKRELSAASNTTRAL
jgi:hypothetical protein